MEAVNKGVFIDICCSLLCANKDLEFSPSKNSKSNRKILTRSKQVNGEAGTEIARAETGIFMC